VRQSGANSSSKALDRIVYKSNALPLVGNFRFGNTAPRLLSYPRPPHIQAGDFITTTTLNTADFVWVGFAIFIASWPMSRKLRATRDRQDFGQPVRPPVGTVGQMPNRHLSGRKQRCDRPESCGVPGNIAEVFFGNRMHCDQWRPSEGIRGQLLRDRGS